MSILRNGRSENFGGLVSADAIFGRDVHTHIETDDCCVCKKCLADDVVTDFIVLIEAANGEWASGAICKLCLNDGAHLEALFVSPLL